MISAKDLKCRITLRLTRKQFDSVLAHAQFLGVSPSHYIRMCIDSQEVCSHEDEKSS